MGSGLLILISKGKQNLYLNENPDITFFKIMYKRYTNFSIETVPQYFKSTPDFDKKNTVVISKNADLINQLYLYIKLPAIPKCYHSILPNGIKKFRWVSKIGWAIIRTVDIEIGGMLVDRHYSEWLNIWNELNGKNAHIKGLNNMIGNIDKLTTFTNGKESYSLYIPLNFWFCNNYGLALPIIALMHNEIKVHVEFNSFSKCYIENATHYITIKENYCLFDKNEIIYQTINGTTINAEFIYFDINTNYLYYNKINGDFLLESTGSNQNNYMIKGYATHFQVTPIFNNNINKDEGYFKNTIYPSIIKSFLLVNYIYLDNQERSYFLNTNHEYLINTLQLVPETVIYSNNSQLKLKFIHPCKQLIWRFQMKYNKEKNDIFNYSLNIRKNEKKKEIVLKEKIEFNGKNRLDIEFPKYYKFIQNYQNFINSPSFGIHTYSFSLYPDQYQPSGTINFSKLDDATLKFNLDRTISYQNYVTIKIFAINYNLFRIINGLGGIVFNR